MHVDPPAAMSRISGLELLPPFAQVLDEAWVWGKHIASIVETFSPFASHALHPQLVSCAPGALVMLARPRRELGGLAFEALANVRNATDHGDTPNVAKEGHPEVPADPIPRMRALHSGALSALADHAAACCALTLMPARTFRCPVVALHFTLAEPLVFPPFAPANPPGSRVGLDERAGTLVVSARASGRHRDVVFVGVDVALARDPSSPVAHARATCTVLRGHDDMAVELAGAHSPVADTVFDRDTHAWWSSSSLAARYSPIQPPPNTAGH